MVSYRYYLGPLIKDAGESYWRAPDGAVGMVDLGSPLQCARADGDQRPIAFLASSATLDSTWAFLGEGDCREIASTNILQDIFRSLLGYRPEGERLSDLLFDCLTGGSDPDGASACLPLVPTVRGNLELWLPGHSLVKTERFIFGRHRHTSQIKALLHRQLVVVRREAHAGHCRTSKGVDLDFHRRYAKALLEKYRISWNELKLPPGQWPEDETPLEHETTLGDTFVETVDTDLASHTATGPNGGWNWGLLAGAATVDAASDKARATTLGSQVFARADRDLATTDHYAEASCDTSEDASTAGTIVLVRKDSSATLTYYANAITWSGNAHQLYKVVNNSFTSLGSVIVDCVPGTPVLQKVKADGSTISGWFDNVSRFSVTDTAITTGLRGGMRGLKTVTGYTIFDSFAAADLLAGNVSDLSYYYRRRRT